MSLHVVTYSRPKSGHEPHENQDSWWTSFGCKDAGLEKICKNRKMPESGLIAAVSDGASEGLFSGIWAKIVASHADKAFEDDKLQKLIEDSLKEWSLILQQKISEKANQGTAITRLPSWLEETSLEQGGFATLAAIRLQKDHSWSAVAIGDSCIFHVRKDRLESFPIKDPTEFKNRPYLLSSIHGLDNSAINYLRYKRSRGKKEKWKSGDVFYIMSDAMACCFLQQYKLGEKPWLEINCLGTSEKSPHFDELIAHWRNKYGMRNDDVTLIRIDVK